MSLSLSATCRPSRSHSSTGTAGTTPALPLLRPAAVMVVVGLKEMEATAVVAVASAALEAAAVEVVVDGATASPMATMAEELLAAATVAPVSPSVMVLGRRASTSPAAVTCAWRKSSSARRMTPPSSTLVSISRSTTTFPSRPLVLVCQSLLLSLRTHLWIRCSSRTSATLVTLLPLPSKSIRSLSLPQAET